MTKTDTPCTGIVIVDHGSRRDQSNQMLLEVARLFDKHSHYSIVEPAHMELAEPSIDTAFARCVERGALRVVISPFFLLPGKHWYQDIPALAGDAAKKHPGVSHMVSAPIGTHPLMAQILESRIGHCLAHVQGEGPECEVCRGTGGCQMVLV